MNSHLIPAALVPAALATLLVACGDPTSTGNVRPPHFPTANGHPVDPVGTATGNDRRADDVCVTTLSSSTELDLSLRTVTLTGTITLDGAPVGDQPAVSGGLSLGVELVDVETGFAYPAAVDPETSQYAITLFAGTYDVGLLVYGEGRYLTSRPRLGEVAQGVVIETDRTWDADIPVAVVDGTVTVNGAPLPENGTTDDLWRGDLHFTNIETGAYRLVELAPFGAAVYRAALVPGTYRVTLLPGVSYDRSFDPLPPVSLPRGPVELGEVTVGRDATLDFDATSVRVSGQVEGATQWMSNQDHALRLDFYRSDTGALFQAGVDGGTGSYSLDLPPGDYQVSLRTRRPATDERSWVEELSYQLCIPEPRSPCSITTDTVLDWSWPVEEVEAHTISVTGEVRVDGETMRDAWAPYINRGWLVFHSLADGGGRAVGLGGVGPASFEAELVPGVYRVHLESSWNDQVLPPSSEVVLADGVDLRSSTRLELDARTAHLSGEIQLNGTTMADDGLLDGSPRGAVQIVDSYTGRGVEQQLGEVGPAEFDVWVFESTYDVRVTGSEVTRAVNYYSQDVLPGGVGVFAEAVGVEGDTRAGRLNREVIDVAGTIDIDGEALGAVFDLDETNTDLEDVGELVFIDVRHGIETYAELAGDGYFVRLYAGDYVVELRKSPYRWQPSEPLGATRIELGCRGALR